ncbi:ATP-dependent bile acid permease-like [Teratosphaeria destructans]|uniref:ATP-dependent bile acid permease-like n=1 Tax=Teratosphaeria destructans TaxID=418781 RepID=A0A9W7SXS0_9PEZI|nr:ATP-dependent bile acid permease-like [Teratosphaeria destructans]
MAATMQHVLASQAVHTGNIYQPPAANQSGNAYDYCFGHPWDAREARFRACFLPLIPVVPAAVAAFVLLVQVIRLAIPSKWRPIWTRSFIEEHKDPVTEDLMAARRTWSGLTVVLLVLAILGLILSVLLTALRWTSPGHVVPSSSLDPLSMPSVATWLMILSLIVICRPRQAPISILFILIVQLIHQAIVLAAFVHLEIVIHGLEIATTSLSILAILAMPLRDQALPAKDISAPGTEPTSGLRSPEDNLGLWQFMTISWMGPLIRIGSKRQLEDDDVWQLAFEFQHRRLHDNFRVLKGTVVQRLLKANAIDLVILTFLGILEMVAQYAVPVLLQLLLASMEDPEAPKRAAITYAALQLAARLVAAQSGVFSLWFGRRCYERSRGEMITMLYEKTLGRKMAFQQQEVKESKHDGDDMHENGAETEAGDVEAPNERKLPFWTKYMEHVTSLFRRSDAPKPPKEPASMGKILNLMRNDVYEVAQRFWEFQQLITKPLSCIFSVALVVRFLGWSSLLAVLVLALVQALNAVLARLMIYFEKKRRSATDKKLSVISQFVEAIRHLRWYGWQGAWLEQILEARQKELNLKIVTNLWNILIAFTNTLSLDLTPVVAFFAYTVIANQPLRIDVVFPAMTLFQMMTQAMRDLPNLIIVLINAWVAVDRIEDFMAEPDKQEMNTEALIGDSIAIEHGSFCWPGVELAVLKDIDISFPVGLTVICGEVASGKTALLQALLGELDMLKGRLFRPAEPVGYCAQTPWLQSMSIRENILFSAPYEDQRYKDVLDACALTPDLAEFKAGDLSLIGENGIGLSGGQKARVALARAVYSRTKILLLDDPLSALDQQTAESIVQKCFAGPLLKDRTVILVTHRTDLVLGIARQVVRLDGGKATVLDSGDAAADQLQPVASHHSRDAAKDQATIDKQTAAAVPEKFIEDEHREHGGVKAAVYMEYIKAGKLRWWAVLIGTLALYRVISVGEAWFLKTWAEAYDTRSSVQLFVLNDEVVTADWHPFGDLPPPEDNIKPWLTGFFLLALGQSLSFVLTQSIMLVIVYTAARRMFRDIMDKVAHASFRFYDTTPVGRLMNRMTSDIGVIDGNISRQFQAVAWLGISLASSIIVVASVTPIFLAFQFVLIASFVLIFRRFLPTSQSLRRLEMVSLTPLMSNFGALLNGLTTVRAFSAQSRFQDRVIEVVDTFQKMDHFYWSLQAWLMYRFDALSATSTFLLTLLALVTGLSPGLTAFVLTAAAKFVLATHGLCRQYGELQMQFVSVERVVELLDVDQEPKGDVSPPAWWPSFSGSIEFNDVTIKYAPHLEPALAGISFTIQGGFKTAVIGRTGSGKSTLALAMLATILPTEGQIIVDGLDLAKVEKQLLRTRVTFLAQDPVLFPGTMRENLDPVQEHSDDACDLVLRRVCDRQGWDRDTIVEAGGRNLSQGQRQLVGLARAVLRRSAIIILDEATASIDRETAMQIQQVMQEEMKESTVITIAHRLEAVRNADYCIVLGKGRILEQGPAAQMLKEHSGDMVDGAESEVAAGGDN